MGENEPEESLKLFGALRTQSSDISHGLSEEELADLAAPLEDGNSVYVRCLKMRMVFPITEDGREELLQRSGATRPADWSGSYFEVKTCPFCGDMNDFEDPILKRVESA